MMTYLTERFQQLLVAQQISETLGKDALDGDGNLAEGADEVLVNGDSFIPNARALEPVFKAQVVMFNPVDFPNLPIQYTRGLELYMTPDGHYWTQQYGTSQGNLTWVGTTESNDMLYLHFNVGF